MKKGINEKIGLGLFKICKYAFFDIWKKVEAKKLGEVFLRFVSILFFIFQKEDKEKNWAIYFEICKYTFFSIWKKGISEEIGLAYFEICKYTFFLI